MEYYFTRSREYYEEHEEIITWHNFFSKHAWNKTLQKAFRSFLKDHEEDIAEIKSNF